MELPLLSETLRLVFSNAYLDMCVPTLAGYKGNNIISMWHTDWSTTSLKLGAFRVILWKFNEIFIILIDDCAMHSKYTHTHTRQVEARMHAHIGIVVNRLSKRSNTFMHC